MTPAPSWLLAQNKTALFKKAAQSVVESVTEAIRLRRWAVLAISGGSTPQGLFETLVDPMYSDRINWAKLHIFFVDERCVPPQHADSNFRMADQYLFSKVPIPKTNIHRMAGEMASPQEAARAYENEIRSVFDEGDDPPRFDLILLGMGEDGHTASLFPRTEALKDLDHWVAANYVEKLSASRLTLTFKILNGARKIIFLISGTSKAEILKVILTRTGEARLPAQMVQPTEGEVVWLFDADAASKLPGEIRFKAFHI